MLSAIVIVVDEVPMRKFRIDAMIRQSADARTIEPLHIPRWTGRPAEATSSVPPAGGLIGLFAPSKKAGPNSHRKSLDPTTERDDEQPDGQVDAQTQTE